MLERTGGRLSRRRDVRLRTTGGTSVTATSSHDGGSPGDVTKIPSRQNALEVGVCLIHPTFDPINPDNHVDDGFGQVLIVLLEASHNPVRQLHLVVTQTIIGLGDLDQAAIEPVGHYQGKFSTGQIQGRQGISQGANTVDALQPGILHERA